MVIWRHPATCDPAMHRNPASVCYVKKPQMHGTQLDQQSCLPVSRPNSVRHDLEASWLIPPLPRQHGASLEIADECPPLILVAPQ